MWASPLPLPTADVGPLFLEEDEADYSALKVDSFTFFDETLAACPDDAASRKSFTDSTIADGGRNSSASSTDGFGDGKRSVGPFCCCCCDHRDGASCFCGSLAALPPLQLSASAGPSPPTATATATCPAAKTAANGPALRPLLLPPLRFQYPVAPCTAAPIARCRC